MRRALDLAARGRGSVEPNPMVGCVIVQDGVTLGEGYHRTFGGPHAEREALTACLQSPAGATAYVTLEPCCHTAKKTPPCVPALIQAALRRIVVACADPNPAVAGKGLSLLCEAGIDVHAGLLEAEARQLNAAFFARTLLSRPYVTLKWAQTADGRVAGPGGRRLQISNAASMRLVHRLRAHSDAILVGIETALSDDPLLTARGVESSRPLLRVVLDSHLRLPLGSQLVRTARQWPLLVYCSIAAHAAQSHHVLELERAGAMVLPVDVDAHNRPALRAVLTDLHARQVTHLLVEGGPTVARSFLAENLVDRVWVFESKKHVAGPDAPAAPEAPFPATARVPVDDDLLMEMLNPSSPVFFHSSPSVDLPPPASA